MFTDLLGSVRAVTGEKPQSGSAPMTECYDYLPFGRMLSSSDNGRNTGCYPANPDFALSSVESQKFTGKVRDSETGFDFFGARYYSGAQGRWMIPDWSGQPSKVPYANFADPQTLNIYAYVRNNPLNRTDPDGHGFLENLSNYLAYGVWGDENAVKRSEEEARRRLIESQQKRASAGEELMLYDAGKKDANGRSIYTTDPNQLSRSAVFNPAGFDLRLPTQALGARWVLAGGAVVTGGTYTLNDFLTGRVMYIGRTKNLARREKEWARDPEKGDLEFNVSSRTNSYAAQRGLEQKLYDQEKPPLNIQRPIAEKNVNLEEYIEAAEKFLESGEGEE
jgi:RHS repeat-associated protein